MTTSFVVRVLVCVLYLVIVRTFLHATRRGTASRWALRLVCILWLVLMLVMFFFMVVEAFGGDDSEEPE